MREAARDVERLARRHHFKAGADRHVLPHAQARPRPERGPAPTEASAFSVAFSACTLNAAVDV